MLTVEQAYEVLKEEGLTTSLEIVRRWIRQGKLKATQWESRYEGYRISREDLQKFILEKKGESYCKLEQVKEWYKNNNQYIQDDQANLELEKILK